MITAILSVVSVLGIVLAIGLIASAVYAPRAIPRGLLPASPALDPSVSTGGAGVGARGWRNTSLYRWSMYGLVVAAVLVATIVVWYFLAWLFAGAGPGDVFGGLRRIFGGTDTPVSLPGFFFITWLFAWMASGILLVNTKTRRLRLFLLPFKLGGASFLTGLVLISPVGSLILAGVLVGSGLLVNVFTLTTDDVNLHLVTNLALRAFVLSMIFGVAVFVFQTAFNVVARKAASGAKIFQITVGIFVWLAMLGGILYLISLLFVGPNNVQRVQDRMWSDETGTYLEEKIFGLFAPSHAAIKTYSVTIPAGGESEAIPNLNTSRCVLIIIDDETQKATTKYGITSAAGKMRFEDRTDTWSDWVPVKPTQPGWAFYFNGEGLTEDALIEIQVRKKGECS